MSHPQNRTISYRSDEEPPSGLANTSDSGHGRLQVTPRAPKSKATLSLSAGHTPVLHRNVSSRPKTLKMDSQRRDDDKESLSAVLGDITNMLGAVN